MLPLGLERIGLFGQSQANGLVVRRAGDGDVSFHSPAVRHFEVPLPVPPVLQPIARDATTDYYEVSMRQATQQILPGLTTSIWGYNGLYPGPTIEARRGRRAVVKQTNQLPEAMSVHNHGGVTPPEHDGYAENITLPGRGTLPTLIQPGGSWTYEYPNQQAACTNWYHDHAVHTTAEHVYRGLAAFYLVRDDLESSFNLPQGPFEVPLVFQDRLFDATGALVYNNNNHSGVVGDIQLVNGAPWPRLQVAARKYRFRLLNGSNWRRYELRLSTGQPFIQIGTESGFLRAPQSLPMLRLYQAERADVVVDFSGVPVGSTVILQNGSAEAFGTGMADVMAFEVVRTAADDSQVPATLAQFEDLTTPEALARVSVRRQFKFDKSNEIWVINDHTWDTNRFEANPRLGTTEIWEFLGGSGWYHPIHVHLIDFQILDRNGNPPALWERGRKDTVALGEGENARVIIKWDPQQYLGFTGPYMIHCHNVDHEDHDMMAQYNLLPAA